LLLLLAGVAGDKVFDDLSAIVLYVILAAALLVIVWPYVRRAWVFITSAIDRRLHPPLVRVVDKATFISVTPRMITTHPFGHASSAVTVVVAVYDQNSKRLDGVPVTFQTDNGVFTANDAIPYRGKSIVTYTDTDTQGDFDFLTYNPGEMQAGTAEAVLDCSSASGGIAGVANITVTIPRPGAHIALQHQIAVRGPTALTGMTLRLLPPSGVPRGEAVGVLATLVDSNGAPVVDGTPVFFAVNGGFLAGQLDAQGGRPSVGGQAFMHWLTDREKFGEFRVVAMTGGVDNLGQAVTEASVVVPYETR
jgi:hypothetical protein